MDMLGRYTFDVALNDIFDDLGDHPFTTGAIDTDHYLLRAHAERQRALRAFIAAREEIRPGRFLATAWKWMGRARLRARKERAAAQPAG